MSHGPEHHLEHAEHASHAAHDNFDKKVTITITIVAAVLAGVTMLGHRSHNQTILEQTEAAIKSNEAANKWNQYQATNIRKHIYQVFIESNRGSVPGKDPVKDHNIERWLGQVLKYQGTSKKAGSLAVTQAEAKEYQEESKKLLLKSEDTHHRAFRFDLGELVLQFGLILCTMSILTKIRGFWYSGMGFAVAGLAVALTGQFHLFLDHSHAHGHDHGKKPAIEVKIETDPEMEELYKDFEPYIKSIKSKAKPAEKSHDHGKDGTPH